MVENKSRLIDATRRLIESGTSEEEAKKSMTDIGVSDEEALSIVTEAQKNVKKISTSKTDARNEKNQKSGKQKPSSKEKESEKKSGSVLDSDFWNSNQGSFFSSKQKNPAKSSDFSVLETKKEDNLDVLDSVRGPPKISHYEYKRVEFRETVPTMVSDFDKLIDRGGLKKSDTILISGGAGTGKTTFAMQFIYMGAKHLGQKGVYLTLEETPEKIKENMMENFGWDIDELEK